ncbi:MAG TPA: hypothetical protein VEI46_08580 [Thermodesulfovibrionales bacterium]|nr:hypothetical protein [Thermodesulfovibrionales bacterium]
MKSVAVISLTFLLFLAASTADTAWYLDVIIQGQIPNAYFAGLNGFDCSQLRTNASKTVKVPQESERYGEFMEQTCIKGRNDNKEFKGNKELAQKEIHYLEKLFVERMSMLKAK